jgi:hypothetical protein
VWCVCGCVLIRAVFFHKRDSLMRNDCVISERALMCVWVVCMGSFLLNANG